jgi:hypothetical protein
MQKEWRGVMLAPLGERRIGGFDASTTSLHSKELLMPKTELNIY